MTSPYGYGPESTGSPEHLNPVVTLPRLPEQLSPVEQAQAEQRLQADMGAALATVSTESQRSALINTNADEIRSRTPGTPGNSPLAQQFAQEEAALHALDMDMHTVWGAQSEQHLEDAADDLGTIVERAPYLIEHITATADISTVDADSAASARDSAARRQTQHQTDARAHFSGYHQAQIDQANGPQPATFPSRSSAGLPEVPSGSSPVAAVDRSRAMKAHRSYDEAAARHNHAAHMRRDDLHTHLTDYATSTLGAYNARIENRNTTVDAARTRAMAEAFTDVAVAVTERYRQRIEAVQTSGENALTLINSWPYGEAAPSPQHEAELQRRMAAYRHSLAQAFPDHADYPENPHYADYLAGYIRIQARLSERQAFASDTHTPPRFLTDRGVQVVTPDGELTLYGDGSYGRQETDGSWMRYDADGSPYRAPQTPEASDHLNNTHLAALPLAALKQARDDAFAVWEQSRSPQAEVDSAVLAREYSDRLDHASIVNHHHVETAAQAVTDIQTTLTDLETNRAAAVDRERAAAMGLNPDLDEAVALQEATVKVTDRINQLRRDLTATETRLRERQALLRETREAGSEAFYLRSFMAVTQPGAAGIRQEVNAQSCYHGEIVLVNATIDDVRGIWQVNADGTRTLLDDDNNIVQRYNAAGEEVDHF